MKRKSTTGTDILSASTKPNSLQGHTMFPFSRRDMHRFLIVHFICKYQVGGCQHYIPRWLDVFLQLQKYSFWIYWTFYAGIQLKCVSMQKLFHVTSALRHFFQFIVDILWNSHSTNWHRTTHTHGTDYLIVS